MAMASVGLNPLQSVGNPSFRAIFFRPSMVELNVRRRVSSAAQSEMIASSMTAAEFGEGVATQNWLWFCTQKTSRQHAVTPRSGGRWRKEGKRVGDGLCCACKRTRTTSNGVTSREVMMLPVVADSILWKIDILGPLAVIMTGCDPGIASESPCSVDGTILSCRCP